MSKTLKNRFLSLKTYRRAKNGQKLNKTEYFFTCLVTRALNDVFVLRISSGFVSGKQTTYFDQIHLPALPFMG